MSLIKSELEVFVGDTCHVWPVILMWASYFKVFQNESWIQEVSMRNMHEVGMEKKFHSK